MSVATTRLNTGGNNKTNGVSLPMIKVAHPSSRLGDPATINVRGVSRQESKCRFGEQLDRYSVNPLRPVTADQLPYNLIKLPRDRYSALGLPALDEGKEEIKFTDEKDKICIPVFGNRADVSSRIEHRLSPRSSSSDSCLGDVRISIDEIENLLREKMKNGYFMIKNAFKTYDPEGRGTVNRESLNRIISNFLSVLIGLGQFNKLMIRLNLDHKKFISIEEFYTCFRPRKDQDSEYPTWFDLHRRIPDKMTATQVFMHLKEKAKQRFLDLTSLVPQTNPDGTRRILKPEFRNTLHHFGFFMEDDEFEKLWAKFDNENVGVISSDKLLSKLGMSMDTVLINDQSSAAISPRRGKSNVSLSPRSVKSNDAVSPKKVKSPHKSPSNSEIVMNCKELDIDKWLKQKFRKGVSDLHHAFLEVDFNRQGTVNKSQFKRVLSDYKIKLSDEELHELLERANLPTTGLVNYRDFLKNYQNRDDNGMVHKILTDPEHPYHQDNDAPVVYTNAGTAEAKLMDLLQKEFLSLLVTFHNLDREKTMVLSPQEFRAVIETKFHFDLKEEDFIKLLDKVPLDENGMVKYADFMTRFDSKETKSLFDVKSTVADIVDDIPDSPPPSPRKNAIISRGLTKDSYDSKEGRTVEDLKIVIKSLLINNCQALEQEFYDLDEYNTKKLTQDMLIKLLKRFNIRLSCNEVKRLWDTLITDQRGSLEYTQFIRHFMYSFQSAAFPNSKLSPPKRGDSDFQVRSKKLNSAYDMLEDNLRSKIDLNWEKLHQHFKEQDPDGKGFISKEQFTGVLQDLCIHLTDYECSILCNKFDIRKDNSVNWIEFLKPFASRRLIFRKGNDMNKLLTHAEEKNKLSHLSTKPVKNSSSVTTRLKKELSIDWKQVRRSLRKVDVNNDGFISVQDFQTALKSFNVDLSNEELFHLLSDFDKNLQGKISYLDFLQKIKSV